MRANCGRTSLRNWGISMPVPEVLATVTALYFVEPFASLIYVLLASGGFIPADYGIYVSLAFILLAIIRKRFFTDGA